MTTLTPRFATTAAWRRLALAAVVATPLLLAGPLPVSAQTLQLPDFTELVERVGPAVVNIRTLERGRAGGDADSALEEHLRRFGIPLPGGPRRAPRSNGDDEPQQKGVGSGFIVSADGYIMTNAHVVDGADELVVTLTDKREFKARLIGADKRTDVALVKIDATGLPSVKIGDSNRLKVGEWVMAIGSPFGLENSVTAGIVSAKARDIPGDYVPFIQTDVAINPGNSGGPLINLRGEVVGINSQIYSRSGGFMGISFAIPVDEAMRVSDQLKANGRVIRGRIGVQIAPVTKDVADGLGLGKPVGALVQSVEKGGPAEKGGVEAGDIIVKVDGKAVEKSGDLPRMIGGTKPGTKVMVQVFRRGATKDIALTVGEFEAERPVRRALAEPGAAAPGKAVLGLVVSDLTDAQKKELNLKGGVRVESAEGQAAKAGLHEGDVILALGKNDVADSKQFAAAASRVEKAKEAVTVLVRRGDSTNYITIKPSR